METLVDDVGSFPLPLRVSRVAFDRAYKIAQKAVASGRSLKDHPSVVRDFYNVVLGSFKKKMSAGLDIVNYPQHYDMHEQYAAAIRGAMSRGTYAVNMKNAVIPEVHVIQVEAKSLSEELGRKLALRVCVTGPMELYLRTVGTVPYEDSLMMFAESCRRFAENAILDSKYVKTEVVSLDEPSFGILDVSADSSVLNRILEKAFDFKGVTKQIHLHSASRIADLLSVANLDVLAFEYAASPKNVEAVSRKDLERADKSIRVGVARTDIDALMAEACSSGVKSPDSAQLVESERQIRKRYLCARERYGNQMTFAGPDCGLGGWPTQESAQLLLRRTVGAVKRQVS